MAVNTHINKPFLAFLAGFSSLGLAASPSPIDLQSACPFVALAGTSIGNSGPSSITGDVGSASQSGFGTVTLIGSNHLNGSTTTAAQGHLSAAYSDGAGRLTTTTLAATLDGAVLVPGVYDSVSGAFSLTGVLTLDGGGDGNAVFILKTATTLNTAAASLVTLTNGAQAKNVYWAIGSSATLGASSLMQGTLMAVSAITLGASITVTGRVLAMGAGVVLDSDAISHPGGCATPTPTPTLTPTPGPTAIVDPGPSGGPSGAPGLRSDRNVFDPRRQSLQLGGQMEKAGRLELEVYDLAGQLVRSLLSQELSAGPWHAVWDGRNHKGQLAASDVYLILARQGAVQHMIKAALLRD